MNLPKPFRILLIQTPCTSPAALPYLPVKLSSVLSDSTISLSFYDSNLDFFLRLIQNQDPGCSNPTNASFQKRSHLEAGWQTLHNEDFYFHSNYTSAIDSIDRHLKSASSLFPPSVISWGSYFKPDVTDESKAIAFITSDDNNPFAAFCRESLSEQINAFSPHLLILCAPSPSQGLAAFTLSRLAKEIRPGIPVVLIGTPYPQSLFKGFYDAAVMPEEIGALIGQIRSFGGPSMEPLRSFPNLHMFPLEQYASPESVLPISDLDMRRISEDPFAASINQFRIRTFFMVHEDHTMDPFAFLPESEGGERSCHYAVQRNLDREIDKEAMVGAYGKGLRMIVWENPTGSVKSLTRSLWNTSDAGIWNHVIVNTNIMGPSSKDMIHFMTTNPNIVHSWVNLICTHTSFTGHCELEAGDQSYPHVTPLPGKPFWNCIADPVHLLLYLVRHGAQNLVKQRIKDDRQSVYSLGENIAYHFQKPQDLPSGYMDEICRMVEAGGSVDTRWLRYNLERAFLIGYAEDEGVIVGNSSLKHPREEYVKSLSKQAGFDFSNYLERGYTSVRPEYRGMGIGTRLLEGLTARVGDKKLYSIISEDNLATQKMAIRNHTQKVAAFYSHKTGKEVGVWVPSWMLEKKEKYQ
ncbi:MAG: GNAT family N-acetyltransferase [Pseudomonadota bacterium]